MEQYFTGAQLAEMRRKAYHSSIVDTAKAIADNGLPADLVTIKVAARLAYCTCTHIRRRIKKGHITAYRAGSRILIPLSQVIVKITPRPILHTSSSD